MCQVVVTDWVLEQTGDKIFGMCTVDFPECHKCYNIKLGFPLPKASHARCAIYSIITALRTIKDNSLFEGSTVGIATKNKWIHELLTNPDKVAKWIRCGVWPRGASADASLLSMAYGLLESIQHQCDICLLYIPRDDEGDKAFVNLDERRGDNGIDMDSVLKEANGNSDAVDRLVRDTRMHGVMAKELCGSGARAYRKCGKKVKQ